MASGSGPSHSAFGLGRKKKSPGLMDQISKIFAGDKKKRSKGSFRGHTSPQTSSTRRKPNENAVVKFFRSLVASSPRPKSRWRDALGLNDSLLVDDFETARLFMTQHRLRRPKLKEQSPQCSDDANSRAHCRDSSACDTKKQQEKPNPALPQNAGAPSSKHPPPALAKGRRPNPENQPRPGERRRPNPKNQPRSGERRRPNPENQPRRGERRRPNPENQPRRGEKRRPNPENQPRPGETAA